jgi:enoyl-[acyl-carrier protein] reductase II
MVIKSKICEILGVEYPIFQGGMAWAATAELASAVSNAGGVGMIAAGSMTPDLLREEIKKVRTWTSKPFGVNIYYMSPFVEEIIDVVIEEKVPIVATGAGNPGKHIKRFKEADIKVIPVVASVALAKRLERIGADALIAEGMECGGHIGEITTIAIIPQITDAVNIPVIAAGGIADGRGMAAAFALGAQGIQMGTRFICSKECIAHENFKRKIIEARDRTTTVTGRRTGHPVRVLQNRLSKEFEALEEGGASKEELERLGEGKLRLAVIEGDMEWGSLMAGQISGMIKDIKSCKEIIEDIVREAVDVIRNLEGVIDK